MPNEGGDGGARGARPWPDCIDDVVLYQLAGYHWELKRSLRAASFGWPEAGRDARAQYIAQLAQLREKEQRVWDTYLAPPHK